MAETSTREGAREVAHKMRPSEVNPKLEEAVQNQPLAPHLLNLRTIAIAVGAGLVVALILFLLVSPRMGGFGLILVFFATWIGLSLREYGKENDERQRKRDEADAEAEDEDEES